MITWVVGCDLCQRWTRVAPGINGMKYPHHKPNCSNEGQWVEAKRVQLKDECKD